MIKINLLPPGIFEARVIKRLIVLFSVIVVAIVAGCMYYTSTVNKATAGYKAETAIATDWKNKADTYKSEAASKLASIAPIDAKLQFVTQVDKFDTVYPVFYENLAQYTYQKITYSQIAVAQDGKVTITASAPSLSDAGRYLLNMYRATDLFSSVAISSVPGYPADSSGGTGVIPTSSMSPSTASSVSATNAGFPSSIGQVLNLHGLSSAGMGAVATGLIRSHANKGGFNFTVTCTIKDPSILLPPSPTGSNSSMPGAAGMAPGGVPN
ncbi:MAG: hypothetical protein ABFD46_03275 [Armatimonadota bacterium]